MRRREFLSAVGFSAASTVLPGAVIAATSTGARARDLVPMPARMADLLPQNYMLNTKIFYEPKVYGHTDAVIDLLTELGVRTIRERVTTGTSLGTRNQLYAMPRLAATGTKWHATVGELEDWASAAAINKQAMDFLVARHAPLVGGDLSHLMHSFGGCNEIDGSVINGHGDPEWATHARIMQRALWEQAKANPRTADIPVAGPSTRTDFDARKAAELGDLSQWSEWGNGHLYNKGTSPSREIDQHLNVLRPVFPGRSRYIFTETGYNNSPQDNLGVTVAEEASAMYAVRGICDFFQHNTVYGRFELLDDPDRIDYTSQATINSTANREAHFGLVAMTTDTVQNATPDTWRKKPEFYATKRLLHLLSDSGPEFTPDSPRVQIAGDTSDVHHILLQKRNGRHYLVLWRDVVVAKPFPNGAMVTVPRTTLTVTMGTARPIAVWVPTLSGEPIRTEPARNTFQVNLRGALKVVEIG